MFRITVSMFISLIGISKPCISWDIFRLMWQGGREKIHRTFCLLHGKKKKKKSAKECVVFYSFIPNTTDFLMVVFYEVAVSV